MAGTVVASVVKNDTTSPPAFQNSAGTEIGTLCRAWVRWTGSTGGILASFNVSSVTRTVAGGYTIAFTNALTDANYSVAAAAAKPGGNGILGVDGSASNTASTLYVTTWDTANTKQDVTSASVAVFR